jgi:mRNA-degrading endonuclease RelE of RelBE toxin-antitoxin system
MEIKFRKSAIQFLRKLDETTVTRVREKILISNPLKGYRIEKKECREDNATPSQTEPLPKHKRTRKPL